MHTTHTPIRDNRGFTLFSVLLVLILLATMGTGVLVLSNADLRSTAHYKTGKQAFYAAESGILHALGVMNGRGVQDFRTDIVNAEQWGRLFGAVTQALPVDAMNTYTVSVAADAVDPMNRGSITAGGVGPMEAARVLRVQLRKGARADQGALYLANDDVDADFGARDQFEIDGNDHTLQGDLNPGGPVRPGISTRNDTVTEAAKDVLSDPQKEKVQGLGFSLDPLNPSIMTTAGPTVTDLDQIVNRLLSTIPAVTVRDPVMASGTYGTLDAPQLTHLTAPNVRLDGQMDGVGILIADGEFTINGSANFIGWVIVRGPTVLRSGVADDTLVDGNAMILGSLWTGDLVVQVGGSAIVDYSAAAMALVDRIGPGNNVPRVMAVASWEEVL